jgi:hypothetical protein
MERNLVALLAAACFAAAVAPAAADGPGVGTPTIVSVGDSAISGEAGRWAGNTNDSPSRVDALGSTAYYDGGTFERIPGCHRSKAAEIHIGGGIASQNLACSGARTYTQPYDPDSNFKPGLDFYDDGAGHIGQAKALQQFAATRNVKMVVVLISANDYGFADIVQTCLINWATSPTWWKNYCYDDSDISSRFTASNIETITQRTTVAFQNLRTAMRNAGYADTQWTLVAQTYSSPLPHGSGIRYSESGYSRQEIGGCGFWNRDADWANNTVVPTLNNTVRNAASRSGIANVKILDAATAMNGRRLCENTVGLLEEKGVATWQSTGAVDKTEWVSQVRTGSTISGPYQLQEGMHPSYWGQKALRNCVRRAYNAGVPRGGTCVRSANGLTSLGEPVMALL